MKKILSFLVMGLVAILPLTVNADSEITYSCGSADAEGIITCSVGYNIDKSSPQDSVSVKLTEYGGADILDVSAAADSDFLYSPANEVDGVWSAILTAPSAVTGEHSLLTFRYKTSGTTDCKVTIGIGNQNKDVVESDTPTENVKTGSTLPYIALGAIAIIAGGAYVATKNKSKMYKI